MKLLWLPDDKMGQIGFKRKYKIFTKKVFEQYFNLRMFRYAFNLFLNIELGQRLASQQMRALGQMVGTE